MAVRRTDYIVMASDRLTTSGVGTPDYHSQITSKIVCHSELPLAFAVRGLANVPIPGLEKHGILVAEMIRSKLPLIRSPDELTPGVVRRFLADLLAEGVREARRRSDGSSGHQERHSLSVLFGLIGRAGPMLEEIRFGERPEWTGVNLPGYFGPTDSLLRYYAIQQELPGYFGQDLNSSIEVAVRLHNIIAEGIAQEALQNHGRNQECGGDVDVVVIDSAGCTPLESM